MNTTTIDLIIAKDYANNHAIRKISDNLTVLNTFLPTSKREDGTYGATSTLHVNVTSKTEVSAELESGKLIRVTGFLTPVNYTKGDKTISSIALVAKEITTVGASEDASESEENNEFIEYSEE